jgi:hypothetical protein
MRIAVLMLALSLSFGVQASDSSVAAPKVKSGANKSNMVCRKEMVIGSRIPKRVCRPRRGSSADREASRRGIREASQVRARNGSPGGMRPTGPRG